MRRQLASGIRRLGTVLTLAALLFSLVASGASAGSDTSRIARSAVDEPIRLLVQFQNAPLADDASPGQSGRIAAEQQAFRTQMKGAGIAFREHSSFSKLFNGVAVTAQSKDLGRVRSMRSVTAVYISHQTDAPTPMLASSTKMIGADKAWAGDPSRAIPGVDGTGIKVAIIDTGLDYTHPDLGGCFGPGCRVIDGWDFVGADYNGGNEPKPGPDPMDQNGHGTHVAGIIGAKAASAEGVTGVAPGVSFIALKVFGKSGSTTDDIILQALETAYDMKVDVVNMSLGSSFEWPQSPTSQATERLSRKGIFVAVAAGNSGSSGEFAVGSPASGTGSIAVASFENDMVRHHAFLDPAGTAMAFEPMTESPAPPADGQTPELVYVGLGTKDTDFQNPDGTSKVEGKVAFISRGSITFKEKTLRAQQFGAVASIIFNNRPGFFMGTLQTAGNYIPTVSMSQADGQHLLGLLNQGPVSLTWTASLHLFANPTAGLMSDFSSWGPSPDLSVKPDLTAPGGMIYSTFPVSMGSYATLSGTSMASPHVAGAAALVLQAKREMFQKGSPLVKATSVRNLLMNTATPRTEGPNSTEYYPVHLQGAGMIDAWAAITAQQRVWPDKLALGAVSGGTTIKQTINIQNLGDKAESYTFQAVGSGGAAVAVTAAGGPFTVQSRASAPTQIQMIVPDDLPDGGIFSGWIDVVNSGGQTVAHIPYLGFKGDYQAASALDPIAPFNLPWLAHLDGPWLVKSSEIEIHPNCAGCDNQYAYLIWSLARQTPELKVEIWNADTGRKFGDQIDVSYLGRDDGSIQLLPWDGTNDKGRQVPAGNYVLRLMVLRPLGDPRNPAHWDVFTTGKITVVYD
ncbi:MAG TPA: S8 family serine peptidase [Symbiobacteriaceae bacterium]|jgi:subtilisin family serine protease